MFKLRLALMMAMMDEESGSELGAEPMTEHEQSVEERTEVERAMEYVRNAHQSIDVQIEHVKASITDLRTGVKPRIAELKNTLRDLKEQKKGLPKLPKPRKPRAPRDPNAQPKARKKKASKGRSKGRKNTPAEAAA